ncbi:hypothetical protein LNQ52_24290 [Klebsiella pneumoniae subsp. pneumoniae]|nr:hypothetical protein [Klebsiella pneumoniae subsp. pneumoniae]
MGQMVRRFLHIQGLFIYNDIHYPRMRGALKGEEEIAASLAIKDGRSGNKLAGR